MKEKLKTALSYLLALLLMQVSRSGTAQVLAGTSVVRAAGSDEVLNNTAPG